MHRVTLTYDGEVIAEGHAHFYSDAIDAAVEKMPVMYLAVPEDVTMICEKPNKKTIKLPLSLATKMPDKIDQHKAEAAMKRIDYRLETKYPD